MPNQHGFGHHTAEPARLCQSNHNADQMNEYDEEVTHPGNGIKASKPPDCAIFCNSPWTGVALRRNNRYRRASCDRSERGRDQQGSEAAGRTHSTALKSGASMDECLDVNISASLINEWW